MSSYINTQREILPDYADAPELLNRYLVYLKLRKNGSDHTVRAAYMDLKQFFRFLMTGCNCTQASDLKKQNIKE